MLKIDEAEKLFADYVVEGDHCRSDYFSLIKELVKRRSEGPDDFLEEKIDQAYALVHDELCSNSSDPVDGIKFGTSGWRGILGKDVTVRTVACVTVAIIRLYETAGTDQALLAPLGVESSDEAKKRGCVVGFDNRFGGELLGSVAVRLLSDAGYKVYYAGEATTGILSAAVLVLNAAFSINLTPSHNPLEYGGYKYNAADAGPAAPELTSRITEFSCRLVREKYNFELDSKEALEVKGMKGVEAVDALSLWKQLVRENVQKHKVDLDDIMARFQENKGCAAVVDSVHGASRLHIRSIFNDFQGERLQLLRNDVDVTFGGIAPEPSSVNMKGVSDCLSERTEELKIGAIIDPDGDRIRFTDGQNEISMNQFGAMAYHFLVKHKGLKGMVAKTVATSNLANRLAEEFGEELFEPKVGFKEFKPVIGRALVFFEESDGISIIGHTPEKDAYIGLLLAMDMVLTTGRNLGAYLQEIEAEYGAFYPDRDGIEVAIKGRELLDKLDGLKVYGVGETIKVGSEAKQIKEVITLDGRKMIFEDGSWIMIRPSGTEPKVRFYVESRTGEGARDLVGAAKSLLEEIEVI